MAQKKWWSFKTRTEARAKAKALRKRGYRVSVTKARLYALARGFKWEVLIVGKRK